MKKSLILLYINKQYINGNTNFVILRNSGIFQAGYINFLTFRYSIVEDNFGVAKDEIRVTIDVVQEHALGSDTGVRDWTSNTFYQLNDDVLYDLQMYNCTQPHNSGLDFDENNWERQSTLNDDDLADFEAGLSGI